MSFTRAGFVHSGELNEYLVLTQAMFLNNRFTHTQLVDTDCELSQLPTRPPGFSTPPGPCGFMLNVQVLSAPELRSYSGSLSLTIERRSEVESGCTPLRTIWSGTSDRIRLGDFGVIDLVSAQVFFQPFQGAVGIPIDRIIHLHLQNEVGATFEVEPQMDVLLQGSQQPGAGKVLRKAEDAEQEYHQGCNDKSELPT